MEKVNLYKQLLSERNSSIESKNIDNFLKSIFERKDIKQTLNTKNTDSFNQLDFDKMETKNIFHLKNIEKICIKYRLRFLDSNLFKGDYPKNISNIIGHFKVFRIELGGMGRVRTEGRSGGGDSCRKLFCL